MAHPLETFLHLLEISSMPEGYLFKYVYEILQRISISVSSPILYTRRHFILERKCEC